MQRGGLAIFCEHPGLCAVGLQMLRSVQPDVPLMVVVEDLDAIVSRYGEPMVLALLDGEAQIDNVVFVATTNYPEKLDPRLTNRPSRFDEIHMIGMPSSEARSVYLDARYPKIREAGVLDDWLTATKDMSLAHVKELIVSVEVFGRSLEESAARLRDMIEKLPKSQDYANTPEVGGYA